jgi:hypothetical protein
MEILGVHGWDMMIKHPKVSAGAGCLRRTRLFRNGYSDSDGLWHETLAATIS